MALLTLHPGHVMLLTEASKLGELHIVLTTDDMVKHYKSKPPLHSFLDRKKRLEKLSIVKRIHPSDEISGAYMVLDLIKPDYVVLGYDQINMQKSILDKMHELGLRCKISVVPAYRKNVYKSSKLEVLST